MAAYIAMWEEMSSAFFKILISELTSYAETFTKIFINENRIQF